MVPKTIRGRSEIPFRVSYLSHPARGDCDPGEAEASGDVSPAFSAFAKCRCGVAGRTAESRLHRGSGVGTRSGCVLTVKVKSFTTEAQRHGEATLYPENEFVR